MKVLHLDLVDLYGTDEYTAAYETTLTEGLKYERRIFHSLFATNDQKEGKELIFCTPPSN